MIFRKLRVDRFQNQETFEYEKGDRNFGSDPGDLIWSSLPFCGCGDPNKAIAYIVGIFDIMVKRDQKDHDINAYFRELEAYFKGGDKEMYFSLYVLDHLKLTEHGGSIGGSWMSDAGREFYLDAKDYLDWLNRDK